MSPWFVVNLIIVLLRIGMVWVDLKGGCSESVRPE